MANNNSEDGHYIAKDVNREEKLHANIKPDLLTALL